MRESIATQLLATLWYNIWSIVLPNFWILSTFFTNIYSGLIFLNGPCKLKYATNFKLTIYLLLIRYNTVAVHPNFPQLSALPFHIKRGDCIYIVLQNYCGLYFLSHCSTVNTFYYPILHI